MASQSNRQRAAEQERIRRAKQKAAQERQKPRAVTSDSQRSGGRGGARVTQSQSPRWLQGQRNLGSPPVTRSQRPTGSGNGQALVTESLPRPRNPMRGVVTNGRGTQAPRPSTKPNPAPPKPPSRPALPPGRQGGAIVRASESKPENPRRTSARNRLNQAQQGTQGPNRTGQPAGSANRQYGANVVNDAVNRAIRQTRGAAIGRALGIVGTGVSAALTANSIRDPNSESSRNLQRAIAGVTSRMAEDAVGRRNGRSGSRPTPSPTPAPTRTGTGGRGVSPGSVRSTPAPKPTPTPTPSPSPTRSSGSTSSSGGGGRSYSSSSSPSPSPAPSSSSSPAPTPSPTPKPEASKSGGGGGAYGKDGKQLYMADKKNNPLMKRTFGYQTGEGPKAKDGDKGPVSGVGPVASGDKYAAKVGQNRGKKPMTGGRAAMAGSKSASSSGTANRERDILKRLAEMKRRQQG